MPFVHNPKVAAPLVVERGERFVLLSDCDVWDSTSGCEVYVFTEDFRSHEAHDPSGLDHESFMAALRDGKTFRIDLDVLLDHYLKTVLLPRPRVTEPQVPDDRAKPANREED